MCSFMNLGTLRGVSILDPKCPRSSQNCKTFYDTELKVHFTSGHNDLCPPPRKKKKFPFSFFPANFFYEASVFFKNLIMLLP